MTARQLTPPPVGTKVRWVHPEGFATHRESIVALMGKMADESDGAGFQMIVTVDPGCPRNRMFVSNPEMILHQEVDLPWKP